MCSLCGSVFPVLGLCRAIDHTYMNYHQVISPQTMCTCDNCDDGADDVCLFYSPDENKIKETQFNRLSVFLFICVSEDCSAERSCSQSGAPSPSQSTSSHTLSSAKSKGSLRRQSKSVVWSSLCIYIYILCLSVIVSLDMRHPSLIFHILLTLNDSIHHII